MARLALLLLALAAPAVLASDPVVVEEVVTALRNLTGGRELLRPEQMSAAARASFGSISNLNLFQQSRAREPVSPYGPVDCAACEAALILLIGLFQAGTPLWEVEVAVVSLCIVLELYPAEVCDGMVHNYGYQVEYIVEKLGQNATPALFCGVYIGGDCGDVGTVNDWTVDIPEGRPELQGPTEPREGAAGLTVLQVTDVHMDLSYLPGSPTDCGLPCCCLASTGLAGEGQAAAGYWGDYNCDLPAHTFTAMMEHVARTHTNIDYVIYTGDAPAHDVWLQSKENNLEHQVAVLDTLATFLPEVPVYLTLGNHEGFPVNAFATETEEDTVVSGNWLYGGLVNESWAGGLDAQARETFAHNGFYSTLARPGLRIISLNNNFCVGMNFLMMLDFSDPAGQLAWLVAELAGAEERGEAVHLLAHHPPGSCLPGWAREYTRVVNRFRTTIRAQFHGHTHDDWFLVFHDLTTGEPSGTAFVAPSVTPFTDNNPEYRVYTVAGDPGLPSHGLVLDHATWSMDLSSLSAAEQEPEWRELYVASRDLGLAGPLPADWLDVLDRAVGDDELFERLVLYNRQNRPGHLPDRSGFLCRMVWGTDCPY